MPLKGDFSKLVRWSAIAKSGGRVLEAASHGMGTSTLALIDEGFDKEQDPYGQRWAPKKRPDGRRVLQGPTGRLRRWRLYRVDRHGYMAGPIVDYAAPHQMPLRGRRPRRMMIPTTERGIPMRWRVVLARAALRAMYQHFKGE